MPLKINGYTIPWSALTTVVVAIFWLSGLSFQVTANADGIAEQATTTERLARIEVTLADNKEDIDDIKVEQRSQDTKLDKILEKLSEINRPD